MNRSTLLLAAALAALALAPAWAQSSEAPYVEGEILVRYRAEVGPDSAAARALETALGLERLERVRGLDVLRYSLPAGLDVAGAIRSLRRDPAVDFVEPNLLHGILVEPDDPLYRDHQGVATDLQKWVFGGIGSDPNLDAEAAWDLTTGRADVVIAILDTGVDLDHPDLAANIWTNPGEVPGNGRDDDGNGYVDDVHGWDFYGPEDADPNPDLGDGDGDRNVRHGTFVASCAGAAGNDGVGLTGAAWTCRLMALKVFTADGGASSIDIAQAIRYAADNGADVLNLSLGSEWPSDTIRTAIDDAWARGVVQIAAAGNGDSDRRMYPASYAHVVSVGATDSGRGGSGDLDGRAYFSQYGPAAVDVVAPGHSLCGAIVRSVADGNPGAPGHAFGSGTSYASPIVAGLAALVISRARDLQRRLTNDDVEEILQNTARDLPDDPGDPQGADWDHHGRVDFRAALESVRPNEPPVALASCDREVVLEGDVIRFDGSASYDPDGDPITRTWDLGDGSDPLQGPFVEHAYAEAGTYEVVLRVSDGFLTATARLTIQVDRLPRRRIRFSVDRETEFPGLGKVQPCDVLSYDRVTRRHAVFFDGDDVGLAGESIDAFTILPDGDLLLSFQGQARIRGMRGGPSDLLDVWGDEWVEDEDIVRFTPVELGPRTAGIFEFHFDGSDVGLQPLDGGLDAIEFLPGGDLALSYEGTMVATGTRLEYADEDVLRFTPSRLGGSTDGTFAAWFDGSDVGLSTLLSKAEGIDAIFRAADGSLYLSTRGAFSVPGAGGGRNDVLVFEPARLGPSTEGEFSIFLRGSELGLGADVDLRGLHIEE